MMAVTAKVGQRVCVTGYGTAATLHSHKYVVERITKTLLVVSYLDGERKVSRRFRLDDGHSVPYGTWGGTRVSTTCTKPKGSE